MPHTQEVDRDDQPRIPDARRDPSDVEQRIDLTSDRRRSLVDRCRITEVCTVKLLELHRGTSSVDSDDFVAEFGELPRDMRADARGTPGDHRAATIVVPEVVNLSHCS